MPIERDKLFEQFKEMVANAQEPICPEVLNAEELEDAFKSPECDDKGEAEPIPVIWKNYGYGQYNDGVCFLSARSASIVSSLYSKYLDERALVWDSNKEKLFLYEPDPQNPKVAFKGSSWIFAKKLKAGYEEFITLRDIYYETTRKGNE